MIPRVFTNSFPRLHQDKYLHAGRIIQRLVTLTNRVEDMIDEADRHNCEPNAESSEELVLLIPCRETMLKYCRQDRVYGNYKELIKQVPSLAQNLSPETASQKIQFIAQHVSLSSPTSFAS